MIVPGVGHFGHCLSQLAQGGYLEAIKEHLQSNKPFLGICVGMQALFEGSTEDPLIPGLAVVPGQLRRFYDDDKSVPHIGWNLVEAANVGETDSIRSDSFCAEGRCYFVHSYAVPYHQDVLESRGWAVATCTYGDEQFVASISHGNIFATQFHPEKSGEVGLKLIGRFLDGSDFVCIPEIKRGLVPPGLTRRVIACLDVRTNDDGDLVVTKGDKYDVRDKTLVSGGQVRNMGKPVALALKYYAQGADEITFLNITSFRNCPLADLPMMEILRQASRTVFVPLTIGGGIQDSSNPDGTRVSALEVATMYFKSGADKVSIGSDAVSTAEDYIGHGYKLSGQSAIETISAAYGKQAVVVSVDPRRRYVESPSDTPHHTISTAYPGPKGERFCWYQCTVKGGREARDLDVLQLVKAVETMGAGEILLNCIDKDGSKEGFDLELIKEVKSAVRIPVIASSGAGNPGHFEEVFEKTRADAALGAGIVGGFWNSRLANGTDV